MLEWGFSFQSRKLSLLEADAIWPNDYMFLNWYFNWIAQLLKFCVPKVYSSNTIPHHNVCCFFKRSKKIQKEEIITQAHLPGWRQLSARYICLDNSRFGQNI